MSVQRQFLQFIMHSGDYKHGQLRWRHEDCSPSQTWDEGKDSTLKFCNLFILLHCQSMLILTSMYSGPKMWMNYLKKCKYISNSFVSQFKPLDYILISWHPVLTKYLPLLNDSSHPKLAYKNVFLCFSVWCIEYSNAWACTEGCWWVVFHWKKANS